MEKDNVFVDDLRQSIANIIKEAAYALEIHNRMEKRREFDETQTKNHEVIKKTINILNHTLANVAYSNGLSSVLDLNDSSINSRFSAFNIADQWRSLVQSLMNVSLVLAQDCCLNLIKTAKLNQILRLRSKLQWQWWSVVVFLCIQRIK